MTAKVEAAFKDLSDADKKLFHQATCEQATSSEHDRVISGMINALRRADS